jgi:hypothetical protein
MPKEPTPITDRAARRGAYFTSDNYPETFGKQLVHINDARAIERVARQLAAALQTGRDGDRKAIAQLQAIDPNFTPRSNYIFNAQDAALAAWEELNK